MTLAKVFYINQHNIEIYNNKNIKFFSQNSVEIALKTGGSIKNIKKYNLVFEINIQYLKNYCLLIKPSNSYLMIYIHQI